MLILAAVTLLVPPFALAAPEASCFTLAPLAEGGGLYVVTPTRRHSGPVAVRSGETDMGVDLTQCFWTGAGVEVWQESNQQAGLQPYASGGCVPDTVVLGAQAAATRQCAL